MTAATAFVTDTASEAGCVGSPLTLTERGTPRPVASVAGVARTSPPVARAGVLSTGGATVQNLLRQRAQLPADHAGRAKLRDRAIEAGLPLSRALAGRFRGRGEPLDDLYQVAALGLIKAVDGYDTTRPVAFTSYAVPTIVGALKRHFRDTTWRVRVPRRVQELALTLTPASASLTQQLGRAPTLTELATHLGATEPDVAVALSAWAAYLPSSLDAPPEDGIRGHGALRDTLGATDAGFDLVTDQHILQRHLDKLPDRERRILVMRFSRDMTQSEIAAKIGVSQMQISRLLLRSLTALRTGMLAEEPTRVTQRTRDQYAGRRA